MDYIEYLGSGEWEDLLPARDAVKQGGGDPMGLKKQVAQRLVARYHGDAAGEAALDRFQRVIQEKELPEDIPEHRLALAGEADLAVLEVVERAGLAGSRGEVRRMASQGALSIDGERFEDPTVRLAAGTYLVRLGKRRFARVIIE
jgi:tyrosyl-tRNA synthetase